MIAKDCHPVRGRESSTKAILRVLFAVFPIKAWREGLLRKAYERLTYADSFLSEGVALALGGRRR